MKWRCGLVGLLLTVVSAVGVSMDGVALEAERIFISEKRIKKVPKLG